MPERVNNFAIKIATVNGTGSASANSLLMKSIFRSGVPVMGKNYFPSNIQGLPTWYEIRVTKDSYVARSGKIDLMVAMNAETYTQGRARSGLGRLSASTTRTWPRPALLARDDITVLGVPLAKLCNENFNGVRTRILMKNICYAGVLAALLDLDVAKIRELLAETYAKKPALVDSNMKAIELGYNYTRENFKCPLPMHVAPGLLGASKTAGHILIDGNTAAGLGLRVRRRHGGRVVSDHAVHLAHGRVQDVRRQAARRPGDRQEELRVHPGRRRARRHRHGVRRQLEWRACVHRHLRPGRVADERIPGARVLRRSARRAVRHPARGPFDRHADAHPAVRHPRSAPTPRMATPSTSACFRAIRKSASTSRATPSISPSACRRPSW